LKESDNGITVMMQYLLGVTLFKWLWFKCKRRKIFADALVSRVENLGSSVALRKKKAHPNAHHKHSNDPR
jgi:hypothetical protein